MLLFTMHLPTFSWRWYLMNEKLHWGCCIAFKNISNVFKNSPNLLIHLFFKRKSSIVTFLLSRRFTNSKGRFILHTGNKIWIPKANVFLNCLVKVSVNDCQHLLCLENILCDVNNPLHTFSEQTTILVKIFWNFTVSYYRSDMPQLKQNLIYCITNLV